MKIGQCSGYEIPTRLDNTYFIKYEALYIMSTIYQLKIKGHLDKKYAAWFGRLQFVYTGEGDTILTGKLPDQAALHGIFGRIRDLGLTLISVNALLETNDSSS